MTTVTKTRPAKSDEQLAEEKRKREEAAALAASTSWIGPANATYVANTIKKAHKGRFTLSASNGGYTIRPSDDGKRHFTARKMNKNALTGEGVQALDAARANRAGRFAGREFFSNAAKIKGKFISLPNFSQSGDATQQYLFASLIINEI